MPGSQATRFSGLVQMQSPEYCVVFIVRSTSYAVRRCLHRRFAQLLGNLLRYRTSSVDSVICPLLLYLLLLRAAFPPVYTI